MDANELRIGNWVYDYKNSPHKIGELLAEEDYDDYFIPIPLTEEILLKCGFENTRNTIWMKGRFLNDKCTLNKYSENEFVFEYNGFHIKHLHQLQNLYFALTGEELNVEL